MDPLDDLTPSLRRFDEMQERQRNIFIVQTPDDRTKTLKEYDEMIRRHDPNSD